MELEKNRYLTLSMYWEKQSKHPWQHLILLGIADFFFFLIYGVSD